MTAYPAQTRYIARAAAQLGYRFVDLDEGRGYLYAVSDGRSEFVGGGIPICAYPLNSAAAFGLSRDKHHTSILLARAGLPCIAGQLFFLNDTFAKFRDPGREIEDAVAAFARMAHPVFCKPNQGSRGDFAEIVTDTAAFRDYIARVRTRHDSILLQPVIAGDEYRVFCIDDAAIFATRKADFKLTGDGQSSLTQLLRAENAALRGTGVSGIDAPSTLAAMAARYGLNGEHVLPRGEKLALPGRRNLSAGGDIEDFTTEVPSGLAGLALQAAKAIGLRVAGVDVFDVSPGRDLSSLVVLEVNGNPGIQTLENIGRDDVIDRIWQTTLTRAFAEQRA